MSSPPKKKVRTAEVKHKLGEDPIFADNRKKYKTMGDPTSSASEDFDLSAKRHRQQAAKYQQEKADLQRKLDEALNREKSLLESQKKLVSGNPTKNNQPSSRGGNGSGGNGGNPRLAQVLCWNCWEYGHHAGSCREDARNEEAREQLRVQKGVPAPTAWQQRIATTTACDGVVQHDRDMQHFRTTYESA
ncbi:hypothetical protein EV426DRAFT_136307 [Tirmania nivea]|nr:hypothetical protein EV426DRAFT_136307 [Tirmania nivea]